MLLVVHKQILNSFVNIAIITNMEQRVLRKERNQETYVLVLSQSAQIEDL